ncbi:MAG: hypothetical protein JO091_04005 [Acidobacteriaceae bacterium]|nr:hypothetical protein [Acidobacteriaceae bacterium]
MNLVLHLSLLGVLIVAAVAVGLYRKYLEDHCDTYLHLHGDSHDAALVNTQSAICKRLEAMSKIRTALIVAVIVYAVAIAGIAIYTAWNTQGT